MFPFLLYTRNILWASLKLVLFRYNRRWMLRLETAVVFDQLLRGNGLAAVQIDAGIQYVFSCQQERPEIHIGFKWTVAWEEPKIYYDFRTSCYMPLEDHITGQ